MSVESISRYLAAILLAIWLVPAGMAAADEEAVEEPAAAAAPRGRAQRQPNPKGKENREVREAQREARKASARKTKGEPRIMWWNEAGIVEALGLSDSLREQFDAALKESDDEQVEGGAQNRAKRDFADALKAGDWAGAQTRLDDWVRTAGQPIASQGKLKLAVLSKLTAAQREKIVSDYASIMITRWFPRPRWTPRPRGDRKPNKQEGKDSGKKAE
jgi:hypothetical protein